MKSMKKQFSKSMNDLASKASASKLSRLFKRQAHRPQPSQDLGSLNAPDDLQHRSSTSSIGTTGSLVFAPPSIDHGQAGSASAHPSTETGPMSPEAKRAEAILKNQERLAEKAMHKTKHFGGPKRAPAKSIEEMSISSVVSGLSTEQERTVGKGKGKEHTADSLAKSNTEGMTGGKSMYRPSDTAPPVPNMKAFSSLSAGRDMKATMASAKQRSEREQRQYDAAANALKASREAKKSQGKTGKGKAKQSGKAAE